VELISALESAGLLDGVALVSWDLDGTLYSARAMKRAWLAHHFPRSGVSGLGALWANRLFHREVERQRAAGRVDSARLAVHQRAARAEAELLPRLLRHVGPRRDAMELLRVLKARVATHVVVSDFEPRGKLEALGLAGEFSSTHAGEVLGFWKPSPQLLRSAAAAHGVQIGAVLHIGDRDETDGEAARRAGARFWLMAEE
jgi:HAD superfamily hydrolase (TIGR01549 family)